MKYLLCSLLFFLPFSEIQAQRWEFGGWMGISNYFGDLNTNTSFEFLGPGAGLILRNNFDKRWAYRIGLNYGRVGFEDEASNNPFQQARNLSFSSNILEFSHEIEFNFLRYEKEREEYKFTPYISLGISTFYFNPTANIEGQKVRLRNLGTEGQKNNGAKRKAYSPINAAIILGGGFKYAFHPHWALGVEIGVRRTFTDNLDDVSKNFPGRITNNDGTSTDANALSDRSGEIGEPIGFEGKQRGISNKKDQFLMSGISITYTLLKEKCPWPSKIKPW